jgi:hypothetical protein
MTRPTISATTSASRQGAFRFAVRRWRPAPRMLAAILVAIVVAALGIVPAAASTPAPGFAVVDYATGFPNFGSHNVGPVGLAFDSSSATTAALFVMDYFDGFLYKFPPGGGVASPATQVNTTAIPGSPAGLAFSLDFAHLYLARQAAGDLVEISPTTGAILRTVATGLPCATGLATDPLSGDLMVSEVGCAPIRRVSPSTGTVSTYANASVDGITFDPRDGTLYGAQNSTTVAVIDRSGNVTTLNPGPGADSLDGISLAASSSPGTPPFLFVNQNNGSISKITLSPLSTTTVATGGSRGDLSTVGPDGCLYATQTESVIKVTNADGTCSLAPPDPAITATGTTIAATEGASFSRPAATFTDPDGTAVPGDYSATINWGDSTSPSTGTISQPSGPGTAFTVSGNHTYSEEGHYTVTVTITDTDTPNNSATATSPTNVADAALVSITPPTTHLTNPVDGVVANFTDADPAGTVSDYTATINWGDGSSATPGTVSGPNGGPFRVTGTHTYPSNGPFSYIVKVHICDVGGSCVDTTTTVMFVNMTGDAYAAKVAATVLGTLTVAEAGPVDTTAATTTSNTVVKLSGLIVSGSVLSGSVSTAVNPNQSSAQASVTSLTVAVATLPVIKAAVTQASSQTSCSGSTGTSNIASLSVGTVVVASGQASPNTTISVATPVGPITIVLNQQTPVAGGLQVNAAHITGPLGLDVVIGSATSDIHNCP